MEISVKLKTGLEDDIPIIDGVAITMSTVFITAFHSREVLPRMQSVAPLAIEPRVSH
jgi:hypothetical protein